MLKVEHPTDYLKKEEVNSEVAEHIEKEQRTEQIKEFLKLKRYRRSDSPDYDDEITSEEELINTVRSNDSEGEKLKKIQKLFEKELKPNINFQDKDNNDTPLHIAVRKQEPKIIELLIGNGADFSIKNKRERTPLDIAKQSNKPNKQEVINVLTYKKINVPADGSCLFWATTLAYLAPIKYDDNVFRERFKKLFGSVDSVELDRIQDLIKSYNPSSNSVAIRDDETLRRLVTEKFRNRVVNEISSYQSKFEESITMYDFLYSKNEDYVIGGTFQEKFRNEFGVEISQYNIDINKLKPDTLSEATVQEIDSELDKIQDQNKVKKIKFETYVECMRDSRAWGGNHEIQAMSQVLHSNILVFSDGTRHSISYDNSNNQIQLFNDGESHYNFGLVRAPILIEAIKSNNQYDAETYLSLGIDNINYQDSEGWASLHFAAHNGYRDTVETLLSKGANVDARGYVDQTPLHIAAKNGHEEIVEVLLDEGADINAKDDSDWTPLHFAAKNGHNGVVEVLLNKGADFNAKTTDLDWVPLHAAAYSGHNDVVKILLRDTDVNVKDDKDRTPLHYAAKNGYKDIVETLLNKGADFNAKTTDQGCTPLHYATQNGHNNIVETLLSNGAKIDTKDYISLTPLHYAAKNGHNDIVEILLNKEADFNTQTTNKGLAPLHFAAQNGYEYIIKTLLNKGADVNVKDYVDWTPLHYAAQSGHKGIVKILLNKGADINARTIDQGCTSLHYTAQNGYKDIVETLLSNGANIDVKDHVNWTPLHYATQNDHEDIVETLLNAGADVNVKDDTDWSPLHFATRNSYKGIVEILLNKGADVNIKDYVDCTPLHIAAQNGHEDIVEILLNAEGADVNAQDDTDWSPLHFATRNGYKGIVEILLNKGADVNIKDYVERMPLHYATQNGYEDIVETLLNKGADINAKDDMDCTPLQYAVQNGYRNIVETLLSKSADVNVKDNTDWTPLHFAAQNGYKDIIEILLYKGADLKITNKHGKTPLNLAATKKHWEIVLILLKHNANVDNLDASQKKGLLSYIDLFKSSDQQKEFNSVRQRILDSASMIECLSDLNLELKKSSNNHNRKKRNTKNECLFTWEDVDQFNEEEKEPRSLDKIKINSEKFINYIKNLPEEKLASLVHLADKVQVTGGFQDLVNKLTNNQEVMYHLNRIRRASGIAMHGMMAKNVLADFLNGNYQGVAINLGFIAGGQGFARVAQAASVKGTGLVLDGKSLLGRSLKAASPFLARGTSAFVIYDLVNQIKKFKNGTEDALVGIVGDSIYLGVDATEIGIEIAEAFEILEGVSSVTGPIGAAIGAVIFVGTDIYLAVKRVDKINEIIHLRGNERFIEGLRAFIGIQPEKYIEELMEEKQISNQLVKQGLEYLQQHSDIKRYVFSTGKSVRDSCRTIQYKTSVCGGLGGICFETSTVTHYTTKCTTKFLIDSDNTAVLNRKRANIKWSRAKPDNPNGGKLFCLPKGNYESVPKEGAYVCENTIGIADLTDKAGNYTLINLEEGDDYARGLIDSPNIFLISNGFKKFYGGDKNDIFILQGNIVTGNINGGDGIDTLDLAKFALSKESVLVDLNRGYIEHQGYGNNSFGVLNINEVLARKYKKDVIYCSCDTKYVDGRGGENDRDAKDVITIPFSTDCVYDVQVIIRFNTVVHNNALRGNFSYIIPSEEGRAFVKLSISRQSNHRFTFNYTLSDIVNADIEDQNNIRFNFLPISQVNDSFNVTISHNITNNAVYILNDGTEIKVDNKNNLYALQNSNNTVDEIVSHYPAIANRLNMTLFIKLANNETIMIGHGAHEVMHNNPLYKSHLLGNGGENVYVIDSENKKLEVDGLPIPGVVIYDVDIENSIDTIDLRNLVQQARNDTEFSSESSFELQILRSEDDLLLRGEIKANETHEYFTIRLKNGTHRYENTHVVVSNVPMKINFDNDKWSLKSLPLVFDQDKEIIVITPDDVEKDTELVTPREAGNYIFARSRNDLIITNAFNQEESKRCTISLKDFYQNSKMRTLSIKFADKEIILKDNQEQISTARDIDALKKEYKDQIYSNVFNHTRTKDIFFNTTSITQLLVDKVAVSNTIDEQLGWLDTEVVNGFKYLLASTGIVNGIGIHDCLGFESKEDQQKFVAEYGVTYNKDKLQQVLQHDQAVEALVWLIVKSYNDLSLKNPDKEKRLLLKDMDQCFKVVIDKRIIVRLVRHLDEGKAVEKVERFIRNHQMELEDRILHNLQEQRYILSNSTTTHQRSRRAINEENIASSATRVGSGTNDLFGWVKNSIGGLFNSRAALPENNTTQSSISQVDAQVNVDGTIMLLDLLIRKVTGQKHIPLAGESISLLEAQGYALNITTKFEQVLNEAAVKSGISAVSLNFNPVTVQSTLAGQIRNGQFSEILQTLCSSAKKACPEFKQTDKFLASLANHLEEVVAEKEVELLVGKQKGLSKAISNNRFVKKSVPQVKEEKPNTFLNDTSTSKLLGYAERVRAESSGVKAGVRIV